MALRQECRASTALRWECRVSTVGWKPNRCRKDRPSLAVPGSGVEDEADLADDTKES
ncbi:unnamed protein product [Spirodela intermedia]|uniref:Uncharacterized protein n=1 Tax=Spirodela intermedia TaxID=51605 RepID=A0A7I8K5S3_SPIIN|nr:unnamed protein product [Spirodela intermedia]